MSTTYQSIDQLLEEKARLTEKIDEAKKKNLEHAESELKRQRSIIQRKIEEAQGQGDLFG
jgi:NH3-dependent NAD+ synthetase